MKTCARNTLVENAPERLQFLTIHFLGDMPPHPPSPPPPLEGSIFRDTNPLGLNGIKRLAKPLRKF